MSVEKVTVTKVEDKFEAHVTLDDGHKVSKVFDDFDQANDWVSEQSGENEPQEDVVVEDSEPDVPTEEEVTETHPDNQTESDQEDGKQSEKTDTKAS